MVEDIDECLNSTFNDCSINAECNNTDGSYTCICNSGIDSVYKTNKSQNRKSALGWDC